MTEQNCVIKVNCPIKRKCRIPRIILQILWHIDKFLQFIIISDDILCITVNVVQLGVFINTPADTVTEILVPVHIISVGISPTFIAVVHKRIFWNSRHKTVSAHYIGLRFVTIRSFAVRCRYKIHVLLIQYQCPKPHIVDSAACYFIFDHICIICNRILFNHFIERCWNTIIALLVKSVNFKSRIKLLRGIHNQFIWLIYRWNIAAVEALQVYIVSSQNLDTITVTAQFHI